MKTTMKRIALLCMIVMTTVVLLTACGKEVPDAGTCKIVLAPDTVYTVPLDQVEGNEGLVSVLNYLQKTEGLTYTMDGTFMTSVGSIAQDPENNVYLYFWTSVEKDFDVSEYAQTMQYEGKTLTSCGVGALEMTMEDGCIIYISTIQY